MQRTEATMELTGFSMKVPSILQVNEPFDLQIRALTHPFEAKWRCFPLKPPPQIDGPFNLSPRGITYLDNTLRGWHGDVSLWADEGYEGPSTFAFERARPAGGDDRAMTSIPGMAFSAPGVKVIHARHEPTGIESASNPIYVTGVKPERRLYWAELHSQTFFSDGLRCPEELYKFAREEAFLDVFAISDHSESISDRQWEYFVGVTNDYNDPGSFVTLIGQEWTHHELGHRNIYYVGQHGPILRATAPSELSELYTSARQHRALVVPHHSANTTMGVDWTRGHDPQVERLVEIYSVWGNSEKPEDRGNPRPIRNQGGEKAGQHVVDALRLGYRFGFVGGGDIHDGRPGDELHTLQRQPATYRNLYRQGISGIWATDLTREAIFQALWDRRVYATSNVRVILTFSIAGRPMGSEVRESGMLPIQIFVASEVPIAEVTLVKNGQDQQSVRPRETTVKWELEDRAAPGTFYYVRVIRDDGELAWSSPIWIQKRGSTAGSEE
jgi:hypothetical protein